MKHPWLSSLTALLFAVTIFLGAFLLFQVQPIMGQFLLPWFGGTPEVWTSCMLFFQVFLLAGYAYAHYLFNLPSPRRRTTLHVGLLAASLVCLPIIPSAALKPSPSDYPILQILLICAVTVGLPYFLLSATSPLIQGWFSRRFPGRNPYRLYALSNTGSLLALASFPFAVEPLLSRMQTAWLWSISFAVFAVCAAACAILSRRHGAAPAPLPADDIEVPPPAPAAKLLWLALPACASVELLAVTNTITLDIAAIPFLWVLPLTVYLLSFIICFDHQRWYQRWLFVPVFMLGIAAVMYVRLAARDEMSPLDVRTVVAAYVFMLFGCCMVCHGELHRLRPPGRDLTGYYLFIAAGGALGGVAVAVIAPLVFHRYLELELGILAAVLCLLMVPQRLSRGYVRRRRVWIVVLCVMGVVGVHRIGKQAVADQTTIASIRNFFGVLTVYEDSPGDPDRHKRIMQHGTTFHGLQFQAPDKRDETTAYYGPDSGIGLTLRHGPRPQGRRIGIIGLGVGTLAAYGGPTDTMCFYEINPAVERLARTYFTFLDDSAATVTVALGDGRLVLDRQPPQAYDVIVLDAFSSDVVPTHLLTVEAMEIYLRHLRDDGVLAFHISTQHLDLQSVVWKLAAHLNLQTAWIQDSEDDNGILASDWILLARDEGFLASDVIVRHRSRQRTELDTVPLWTDDHINLLKVLKKNPLRR